MASEKKYNSKGDYMQAVLSVCTQACLNGRQNSKDSQHIINLTPKKKKLRQLVAKRN